MQGYRYMLEDEFSTCYIETMLDVYKLFITRVYRYPVTLSFLSGAENKYSFSSLFSMLYFVLSGLHPNGQGSPLPSPRQNCTC